MHNMYMVQSLHVKGFIVLFLNLLLVESFVCFTYLTGTCPENVAFCYISLISQLKRDEYVFHSYFSRKELKNIINDM